ncbi:polymorphic toxin type 23 domain-containing protein [Marivirga tractuosa]|uniref:polymorphic toxin type 23 domain-containing protein n=1 Tax=Marivirga tractuosa TaxID=1006 RepID=UPI0035CF43DE
MIFNNLKSFIRKGGSVPMLIFYFGFLFLSLCASKVNAQEQYIQRNYLNYYIRGGLSLQFGSHQNRVGLNISTSLGQSYANITLRFDLLYTLKDLGYYEKSFQHIAGLKLSTAFQEKSMDNYRPFANSPFSNDFFYEIHYFYRYYFNKWNTNQPTGEIGLNFGHFFLQHENDLLAAKSVDRFRTAAMRIGYQDSVQSIATSFIFWTGNKDDPNTKRINSSDFSRYGYFDLSDTPFGKYSHGILAIDYTRQLPFANQIRFSTGYDHEKIRNAIQNKFMHDLPIWPKKWNTAKSRHVPMVDQDGNAFLYKENQKLREGKFYWGVFLNSPNFY